MTERRRRQGRCVCPVCVDADVADERRARWEMARQASPPPEDEREWTTIDGQRAWWNEGRGWVCGCSICRRSDDPVVLRTSRVMGEPLAGGRIEDVQARPDGSVTIEWSPIQQWQYFNDWAQVERAAVLYDDAMREGRQ